MERLDPPYQGDERTMLETFLDFHRATVHAKCAKLAEEDAWRSPLPSEAMSAAGVVSHLIAVELYWFEYILAGRDVELPWTDDGDPDIEFRRVGEETLESVLGRYAAQCETSRQITRDVPMDALTARQRRGEDVAVRHVYVQMVQETARHNGHLDAIRELIDGTTGE